MQLPTLDLAIIIGYIAATVLMGLYFAKRATGSVEDFFVGGRKLPWWLAGTSMIASSFSIDTPLGITGWVAARGIKGVWFAWSYIIGGAGTFGTFIFAALLRRSNIITTAELVELRYAGKSAAFLRGFKGVYFGILAIAISMGWVIRSVRVLTEEALGWDILPTLVAIMVVTLIYTAASGLWGVAATDFVQFFVGTAGSLLLAYFAVKSVGGVAGLQEGLVQRYGEAEAASRLQFIPRPGSGFFQTFLVFLTLKWWGNPPSSINQRIMSTKDERHATFATLAFATVHFAINYWPMILVALVTLVAYPDLPTAKAEYGYAKLIVDVLPTGVLGIVLASSTAAFMSTIDTQVNVGASYMVNDIYRRFIHPKGEKRHFVWASRVSTVIMLALAIGLSFAIVSVKAGWDYLAYLIAGYGFVVVARWFWWRINAWSEIASLVGSGVGTILAKHVFDGMTLDFGLFSLDLSTFGGRFIFIAAISIVGWVVVALATRPDPLESLAEFCRAVRPYPVGWGPVREAYPDIEWSPNLLRNMALWFVAIGAVFSVCFGIGHTLLGTTQIGFSLLALALVLFFVIVRFWKP
jgi:solute:Na+ symporter, SSS family